MKTAIISGVSRGIGLALFAAARDRFDHIVAIGRTPPPPSAGALDAMIQVDLAYDHDGWDARLRNVGSPLTDAHTILFVDNAAVHEPVVVDNPDFGAAISRAAAVNLIAPAAIVSSLIRLSRETGAALVLLHVDTGAARRAIESWGSYCTSKAAAAMFYQVIAAEQPDVVVRSVDPGVVNTQMQAIIRDGPDGATRAYFRDLDERGELSSPEQAAERILAAAGID